MMRIPTVPGVFFPVGDDVGHIRIIRIDRLDDRHPAGWARATSTA